MVDKVITYPIAGDQEGGCLFLCGKPNAANIAILSAGYPDDQSVFLPLAKRLSEETDTLCGITCLPGYDERTDRPYTSRKKDGYTFDEMSLSMRQAVKTLRAYSTNNKAPLTGIFHDWGVFPGSVYTNEAIAEGNAELTPSKIVLFDVMGPPHPDTKDIPIAPPVGLKQKVIEWTYRLILASAFFTQRYFSKFLAKIVFIVPNAIIGSLKLSPTLDIDAKIFEDRPPYDLNRLIYMCYPYLNMYTSLFSGGLEKMRNMYCLPKDLKKTPVLYMYGVEKNCMFHEENAVMLLRREEQQKSSKSRVVAVKDAGHWLYIHQAELCFKEVASFLTDA